MNAQDDRAAWVLPGALALERVRDGVVALDREWRYVYINTTAAALLGWTPEGLIGKHIWTEFPEGVGQPFQRNYERALAEQTVITFEDHYAPWDRWFENRIYPSEDGISIFFHETTDRVRATRALAQSEEQLRSSLAAARAGTWDCDLATGWLVTRSEPGQSWGIAPACDGPYADYANRIDAVDRAALGAAIAHAIQERSHFTHEVRLRDGDAGPRWLACSGAATYAHDNTPLRLRGTVVDITARKRAELAARCQTKVLERIGAGATLAEALDVLTRGVETQLPGVRCSILLLDEAGAHLHHAAGPSLPAAYVNAIDGAAIGPKVGSCGTAAFRREPVHTRDIATDPLWEDYRHLALPHGLRACWSTPIFDADGRLKGTFALYYDAPRLPDDWQIELITMATHTAAIAISSEDSRTAVRSLGARLLQSQDDERRRIARDLHDATVQHLAALSMNLAVIGQRHGETAILSECQRLAETSIAELRTLSYLLHPPMLDDFGLARAVEDLVEGFERRSGIAVELVVEGDIGRLAREAELALYRALQECLTNISRHSGSPTASVRLHRGATEVLLEVEDAGSGWGVSDVDEALASRGVGLAAMRERLRAVGGHVVFEAGKEGARVRAAVPAHEATP